MKNVVIVSARRTPIGAFQGALASLSAVELGTAAARSAIDAARIPASEIQEVIMGCVLPAGLGQAPARQVAIAAGVPTTTPATTINKMCGSGLKSVMMAASQIHAGEADVILAGGLESMSNAPYLLPKVRAGLRMGHAEMLDHMYRDGLQSVFDGQLMGCFAERTAEKYNFSRAAQDAFTAVSVRRAIQAASSGSFAAELTPVIVKSRRGETTVEHDETPTTVDVKKIPMLKPAFARDGTVTAASSSSIADGAAAVVLMNEDAAKRLGATPLARIVSYASHAHEPEWFTTAPAGAIRKVLRKADWQTQSVDLWEINEAFAAVTMAAMHELGLDHDNVNVHGGACALGHPVGASGARILATLIHALKLRGGKRGVASLCLGGGEAVAMAVEVI